MIRFIFGLLMVVSLVGCKTSQQTYFSEINKLGFIPFRMPISGISTGTIVREEPTYLSSVAPPTRCFPDDVKGKATNLRWVSGVSVPSVYRNLFFSFDGNLNSLMAMGAPGFQFNLSAVKVQTVKLDIREAQIEMLDQIAVQEVYTKIMSKECHELVTKYPFVLEALQVASMSFEFFDAFGGKIQVDSANIGDFALFGADIKWYIEQGSKLVVTTPKFIAYRLGQLRPEDNGYVRLVASKVKNGKYVWFEGAIEEDTKTTLVKKTPKRLITTQF